MSYTDNDIDEYRNFAVAKERENDWQSAINYTFKQIEASKYVYGINSIPVAWAIYNLTMEFPHTNDIDKSIEWGNKTIDILSKLAKDTFNIDLLARVYGNVCNAYLNKGGLLNDYTFFEKAKDYSEKALSIRKNLYGANNELFANSLINYAFVQNKIGNVSKSIESFKTAYEIYQNCFGLFAPKCYNAIWGIMQSYYQAKDYNNAINISLDALIICDSLYSKESEQYIQLLNTIQYYYYCNNEMEKSIEYANKAYQLCSTTNVIDETKKIVILNLMRLYEYTERNDEVIRIGQESIEFVKRDVEMAAVLSNAYKNVEDYNNAIIYKSYAVKNSEYPSYRYIDEMEGLGSLYISTGDYQKSKSIYDRLLHLCDSLAIKDSVIYSNVLSHSAIIYNDLGEFDKSLKFGAKCLQIRHDLVRNEFDLNNSLPNYVNSLINYAAILISAEKDYSVILPYLDEALQCLDDNKSWYSDTLRYSRIIALKGTYYKKIGKLQDAIDYFIKAAKLQDNLNNVHFDYAETLSQLSKTYEELLDYESAYNIAMKAKTFLEGKKAEYHPEYAKIIEKLACLNYYMGNYPQAMKLAKEIIGISKKTYGERPLYAQTLNNLAAFYQNIGDFQNSLKYYKIAYEILESSKNYGERYSISCFGMSDYQTNVDSMLYYLNKIENYLNHSEHRNSKIENALISRRISYYLNDKNDTIKALELCKEAMDLQISTKGKETLEYADILDEMYLIYRKKDMNKAFLYCDSAFQIRNRILMKSDMNYANALLHYTRGLLDISGNKDSVVNYYKTISDILINNFNQSILSVPYKNARSYWDMHFRAFFNYSIPLICCNRNTEESNKLLYDALLFSKGLLLSVDMNLRSFILSSNNKKLISIFEDYNKISAYINAQIALPDKEKDLEIDSIIQKQDSIGWLISKMITENGYNMLDKSTWADVQKRLKEREVAIEFGNYTNPGNNILYYALVINKQSKTPKLYNLFSGAELDSIMKNEKVDSLELSNLIWGKLLEEIDDASNVYFSPSGRLELLGIEYLPIKQSGINGSLEFIRLSSTRELCKNKCNNEIKCAILYGGIDYNSKDKSRAINNTVYFDKQYTDLSRSISDRGSFDYLENTIEEVRNISKILMSKGVNCEIRESSFGTEESLKELSGMPIDIIHLATHGMYINLDDSENNRYKFVLSDERASDEENAMSRSFVVMSGGNMLLNNDSINIDNDGILTANEISYLDLHNIGLVTLSACDTAKGDITYDGIVGLQRGFKKAGVKSLLLSLNKVDDEATKILMVEFYKNLTNGKTKHQSLKEAQKHLRQVDNGKFNKPEYWASFIMLDGIN